MKTTLQLSQLLADIQVAYTNLRGFHWNIKGREFYVLHSKFEDIYNDLNEKADEIAERILMLGETPAHNYSEYLKISKINNFVKNWIMDKILITPKNEKQLQLLKLLLEEMKIKFRYEKNEGETINSELEDKINEARTEKKEGKLLTIDPKKIWESI